MDFRLKITRQARRYFDSVWRYISPDSPTDAADFCGKLLARARSLTTFPYRHGSWFKEPNIRKVPLGSYTIFYKIYDKEGVVEVLRFWHAARDQGKLRLKEEANTVYGSEAQTAKLEA